MRYLLDTHILLWALSNDPKLPSKARMIIEKDGNDIYYSVISIWEVALKHRAHPNQLTLTAQEASIYCRVAGFKRLSVEESHVFYLGGVVMAKRGRPRLYASESDKDESVQGIVESGQGRADWLLSAGRV